MQKIFISYSRKDMDFGRKLAGDLEKAGYDVWWDISDLRGGDDWIKVIPAAIASSQFILVVLSPNSVQSEWVQKEYTQALNLRKKIIPIMFEATGVPFALNTLNFLNFSAGKYEENYKNLLSALGYTGEPPAVTTFIKSRLTQLPGLRKYAIPIGIVVLAILLLVAFEATQPPVDVPPTFTPTNTS
ncbi:MAG TPA: toll/interleukin-1 receptor domain-containing protein, partial [Anaerolineales bacterium]|nr:toll/interleukin-1 receptor domain-containing protein [Anaerolineales bacterium]